MDSSDSDTDSEYNRWHEAAMAHACEWCLHDQNGGICNGRAKECKHMASYHEAQIGARLTYLCRDSIRLTPARASLQSRIVQLAASTLAS